MIIFLVALGGILAGMVLCAITGVFVVSMYGPFAEYMSDGKTLLPFGVRLRHFIFGRPKG